MRIFIISIARNKKRQESLVEKLVSEGFDPEDITIILGVDYSKTPIPDSIISKWGKFTPRSVLACAASHVLAWEHISKLDIPYALILEDDSYVVKEEFDRYLPQFEGMLDDNTFLNLSTALTVVKNDKRNTPLFSYADIILALDTYMLTPGICKKLFDYYKEHGLSYHIDLHLTFIKNQIGIDLVHFNDKITRGNMRLESSMVSNHDKKFILGLLKDTETYKELKTPIIEIRDVVYDGYTVLTGFLFIVLVIVSYILFNRFGLDNNKVFMSLSVFWFIWGLLIYDCL